MNSERDLGHQLDALAANAPPIRVPRVAMTRADADAALATLQQGLGRRAAAPRVPPPRFSGEIALDAELIELVPDESEPPASLGAPRGAESFEARSPTRTRPSRPPLARHDAIAEAVSSAAVQVQARREAPPPLPRLSGELDFVLSEDDLIDLEPVEEVVVRRPTVAELLEED